MRTEELIEVFERMLDERWAYEWGAAREGCVDCSGAFAYAFARFGQRIAHGSNTIARAHLAGPLRPAKEAKPGWALFKRRFDGGEPQKYRADGLGNFYHIALCGRDGAHALNAKGRAYGFCSDPASEYQLAAPLKGVDYEASSDEQALDRAIVTTQRDPLRLRDAPETGKVIGHAPKGARVDVLAWGAWPRVRWGGVTGYASGAYLRREQEENEKTEAAGECPCRREERQEE